MDEPNDTEFNRPRLCQMLVGFTWTNTRDKSLPAEVFFHVLGQGIQTTSGDHYRLVWPWMATAVPMKKKQFQLPKNEVSHMFPAQNYERNSFSSSTKFHFQQKATVSHMINGFLVDKKICRNRIWIRHEKSLSQAAWVLSRPEN